MGRIKVQNGRLEKTKLVALGSTDTSKKQSIKKSNTCWTQHAFMICWTLLNNVASKKININSRERERVML